MGVDSPLDAASVSLPTLAYGRGSDQPFPARRLYVSLFLLPVLTWWVRSYWREDTAQHMWSGPDWFTADSRFGAVTFKWLPFGGPTLGYQVGSGMWSFSSGYALSYNGEDELDRLRWIGLFTYTAQLRGSPYRVYGFSDWLIAVGAVGLGLGVARWLPGASAAGQALTRPALPVIRAIGREWKRWWTAIWYDRL